MKYIKFGDETLMRLLIINGYRKGSGRKLSKAILGDSSLPLSRKAEVDLSILNPDNLGTVFSCNKMLYGEKSIYEIIDILLTRMRKSKDKVRFACNELFIIAAIAAGDLPVKIYEDYYLLAESITEELSNPEFEFVLRSIDYNKLRGRRSSKLLVRLILSRSKKDLSLLELLKMKSISVGARIDGINKLKELGLEEGFLLFVSSSNKVLLHALSKVISLKYLPLLVGRGGKHSDGVIEERFAKNR